MSFKRLASVAGVVGAGSLLGAEVLRRKAESFTDVEARREWFQGIVKTALMPLFDHADTNIVDLGAEVGEDFSSIGTCVIAAKHQRVTDILTEAHAVVTLKPTIVPQILAKHQILSWPILPTLIEGTVTYTRRIPDWDTSEEQWEREIQGMLSELAGATNTIEGNRGAAIIHPEGSYAKNGVADFKKGLLILAGKMAKEKGMPVPVVMLAIANNGVGRCVLGAVMGKGSLKHKVEVTLSRRIYVTEEVLDWYDEKNLKTGKPWGRHHPKFVTLLEELRDIMLEAQNQTNGRCGRPDIQKVTSTGSRKRDKLTGRIK